MARRNYKCWISIHSEIIRYISDNTMDKGNQELNLKTQEVWLTRHEFNSKGHFTQSLAIGCGGLS